MKEKSYNRKKAIQYAEKWAYSRNPKFYNYDNIGGDCTNFISQCIYAGCKTMNTKDWYYKNANDKFPSWTGVEFLNELLINNKKEGPQAVETSIENMEPGDIVQLSFDGFKYGHSLIIVNKKCNKLEDILIATHTFNAFNRKISSYEFKKIRFLHITKIAIY